MSEVGHAGVRVGLQKRVCLSCGYDGQPVQERLEAIDFRCPMCDEDLYARPPRSYAEMEGLSSDVVIDRVRLEEWSRSMLRVEYAARVKQRPARIAGLIFGSALGAAMAASVIFLLL
ncbi:MAG: hypothetical protein ACYTF7_00525 [Planctomycetota bacterium]|jgi:predicted RNA-binding Zn-ribbon protein involved in translation (DUF1610 family)